MKPTIADALLNSKKKRRIGEKEVTKTATGKHIEKWKYNPRKKRYVKKEKDITFPDKEEGRVTYKYKEVAHKGKAKEKHILRKALFGKRKTKTERY